MWGGVSARSPGGRGGRCGWGGQRRGAGGCAPGCPAAGCVGPSCEGRSPSPRSGKGRAAALRRKLGIFLPVFPPPPALSRHGERAEISCESRELVGLEGSGVRGFPSHSRVAGQRRSLSLSLAPHQPGRTVPWRGQEKQKIIKEGPTDAMRLRDFHRRDPPPFPGRESRAVPGGPRGCPGWACSRSAPLRVASAAAARQLEAPIAPSVAAVPRFPRREAGGGGREEGVPPLPVRAAGQRARRSHPAGSPAAGWAAPSLPSPGRCSRGGRRRAEERRGNGAWS